MAVVKNAVKMQLEYLNSTQQELFGDEICVCDGDEYITGDTVEYRENYERLSPNRSQNFRLVSLIFSTAVKS